MKTKLTPEQSLCLIDWGINPRMASEKAKVYEPIDAKHRWESEMPVFSLSDILQLLPREIKVDGTNYHLNIDFPPIGQVAARYFTEYDELDSIAGMMCGELIDALFELLCWVLINHPDKIKKLER